MKNIFGKISGLVGSIFLATSAFAWTPTVEVTRTLSGVVQLKTGGWPTPAEMGDMNWGSYRVWMMLNGVEYDVTAAVVSLFTSGHPSVTFSLNGHFELNIDLLQYFGIDPAMWPIGMEVCKTGASGGECANSRESLLKRDPADLTANATCYPDPTCATASGPFTTFPRVLSDDAGLGGYSITGIEVVLAKATTITGFRAIVTNGSLTGITNAYSSQQIFLNVNSTFSQFGASTIHGDIVDRATGTVVHFPFGAHPATQPWTTDFLTLTLNSPITLPAGSYVFSPFSFIGPGGTQTMKIMTSTVSLGTDYYVDGFSNPGTVSPVSSFGGSFVARNTLAVDITGY